MVSGGELIIGESPGGRGRSGDDGERGHGCVDTEWGRDMSLQPTEEKIRREEIMER